MRERERVSLCASVHACACALCRRYAEILGQQHALHELQAPQREQIVDRVTAAATFLAAHNRTDYSLLVSG